MREIGGARDRPGAARDRQARGPQRLGGRHPAGRDRSGARAELRHAVRLPSKRRHAKASEHRPRAESRRALRGRKAVGTPPAVARRAAPAAAAPDARRGSARPQALYPPPLLEMRRGGDSGAARSAGRRRRRCAGIRAGRGSATPRAQRFAARSPGEVGRQAVGADRPDIDRQNPRSVGPGAAGHRRMDRCEPATASAGCERRRHSPGARLRGDGRPPGDARPVDSGACGRR